MAGSPSQTGTLGIFRRAFFVLGSSHEFLCSRNIHSLDAAVAFRGMSVTDLNFNGALASLKAISTGIPVGWILARFCMVSFFSCAAVRYAFPGMK